MNSTTRYKYLNSSGTFDEVYSPANMPPPPSTDDIKSQVLSLVYPIGSIYLSVNDVNPSTFIGGTWSAWGTGRVPVGVNTSDTNFNTVEKTGGYSTHKLTVSEMPAHNHAGTYNVSDGVGHSGGSNTSCETYSVTYSTTVSSVSSWGTGGSITGFITKQVRADHGVPSQGSNVSHNNLQPYITCYMWKRTA